MTTEKAIFERLKNNKRLLSNFSYLAILEMFILIAPLITYPYLVRVLGRDLYGWVITAQITASYCTILIDFGFKRISARHIATNSDDPVKMGEVISAILTLRWGLWLISFFIYFSVIWLIPSYREQLPLFLYSFLTTLSSVLFLDFYFQGIENMKYITIINIIVRGLFVASTFTVIKTPEDYVFVPLLWSIGYVLGGVISIWVAFHRHKIHFAVPCIDVLKHHLREGSIIFTSEAMLTIKDKLNYNIMGALIGMSDIVIYDIGSKISGLLLKPVTILSTALFPQMAKKPSVATAKKAMILIFAISILLVAIVNIFLPWLVEFFIDEEIDLKAVRLYTITPIILGLSSFIAVNVFYVFGKDKLVLKSTYITIGAYLLCLSGSYYAGFLTDVFSFVALTVASFFIEALYRGIMCHKIFYDEKDNTLNHS